MQKNNLIERAVSFAADKHKNQYRKEGGLLYISHLVGVALLLEKYKYSDYTIALAFLHDTLEDTDTTKNELEQNFGAEMLRDVLSVTNDANLRWKEKKLKYLETVNTGSQNAKAVALADKIHNMQSLLNNLESVGPEKVWAMFNTEKQEKLWFEEECYKMLSQTFSGPHEMLEEYHQQIEKLKIKYF